MASSTAVDLLAPVHRLSVAQFQRMAEAQVLPADERVELIDGVVVEMSPMGVPHGWAVVFLIEWLVTAKRPEMAVGPQIDIVLRALASQPVPDVTLIPRDPRALPEAPMLVIEVSDSSLRFDRLIKARLYAEHGIPEYWIVNLVDDRVEVHREPQADGTWGVREERGGGDALAPLALPEARLDIDALLRFAHPDER